MAGTFSLSSCSCRLLRPELQSACLACKVTVSPGSLTTDRATVVALRLHHAKKIACVSTFASGRCTIAQIEAVSGVQTSAGQACLWDSTKFICICRSCPFIYKTSLRVDEQRLPTPPGRPGCRPRKSEMGESLQAASTFFPSAYRLDAAD